jgi:phage shock protein A
MLAEANASAELDAGTVSVDDLASKYTSSADSASVDEELEALKTKLGL